MQCSIRFVGFDACDRYRARESLAGACSTVVQEGDQFHPRTVWTARPVRHTFAARPSAPCSGGALPRGPTVISASSCGFRPCRTRPAALKIGPNCARLLANFCRDALSYCASRFFPEVRLLPEQVRSTCLRVRLTCRTATADPSNVNAFRMHAQVCTAPRMSRFLEVDAPHIARWTYNTRNQTRASRGRPAWR